jgi:hypothetical protein
LWHAVVIPISNGQQTATDIAGQTGKADQASWMELFDGKSLQGWSRTNFGGEGDVEVTESDAGGTILLDYGHPMSGITFRGTPDYGKNDLPKIGYEIELVARRVAGSDFFCGLTFPYKDSHCTLILGGWGGQLVGLSSLDGDDASQNETTDYLSFENGKWYKILLRVNDGKIEARRDGKQIVTCRIGQRKVDTRPEVVLSKPLGVACYQTQAELRHIRIRKVNPTGQGGN